MDEEKREMGEQMERIVGNNRGLGQEVGRLERENLEMRQREAYMENEKERENEIEKEREEDSQRQTLKIVEVIESSSQTEAQKSTREAQGTNTSPSYPKQNDNPLLERIAALEATITELIT